MNYGRIGNIIWDVIVYCIRKDDGSQAFTALIISTNIMINIEIITSECIILFVEILYDKDMGITILGNHLFREI